MSKKLLLELNGEAHGEFRRWIEKFDGEPRIAWYPSARQDLRDLLYLHPRYSRNNPAKEPEPRGPDIFLHTDYDTISYNLNDSWPWTAASLLRYGNIIYNDKRTSVSITSLEELPRCHLPLDPEIVHFPGRNQDSGRVVFLKISVSSKALGNFSYPLVYAFVENAAFCAKKILPNDGRISHLMHVRYGGGLGGGSSHGIWLLNVLRKVGCECFVTDSNYHMGSGDRRIYDLYPMLAAEEDQAPLTPIRIIPSKSWSDCGDVSWNIINPA